MKGDLSRSPTHTCSASGAESYPCALYLREPTLAPLLVPSLAPLPEGKNKSGSHGGKNGKSSSRPRSPTQACTPVPLDDSVHSATGVARAAPLTAAASTRQTWKHSSSFAAPASEKSSKLRQVWQSWRRCIKVKRPRQKHAAVVRVRGHGPRPRARPRSRTSTELVEVRVRVRGCGPEQELPEVREGFFTCSRVKRDDTKAGNETRHVTTYAPFLALWGGHANTVAVNGSVHYLYVTKYIVGAILADSAWTPGR